MKPLQKIFFLFFFLLIFQYGNAQSDLPSQNPLSIKAEENNTTSKGPVLNIPSVINKQPDINIKDSLGRRPVKMLPERELVQAGQNPNLKKKIAVLKEGNNLNFPDIYYGDIRENGEYIDIVYRDSGAYIDDDIIKIIMNDSIVVDETILTENYNGIRIKLKKGFNEIDFKAVNNGYYPPNSAEFKVYNDKKEVIYHEDWFLSKDSKATLIITKE